jgi:ABC-type proline/glycine betaine transport system permease subunit
MDDKVKLAGVICLTLGVILGIAGSANRTYVATAHPCCDFALNL